MPLKRPFPPKKSGKDEDEAPAKGEKKLPPWLKNKGKK